ncbi:MAG TPA: hypothetical protein V6C78_01470 [Crinalium sp.]|jgi:hypothetical protein
MKSTVWSIGLLGMLLLAGCVQPPVATHRSTSPNSLASSQPKPISASPSAERPFQELIASSDSLNNKLPVPGLTAPTGVLERLPQVRVGRADPFSNVVAAPVIVPNGGRSLTPLTASQSTSQSASQSVSLAVPLPPPPATRQTISLVPLPAQPIPATIAVPQTFSPVQAIPASASSTLPQTSVPQTLPQTVAPPARLASTIEVTGVVQVGTQVSAIIQVPSERSSRYVRQGDYLANGQVFVKRIDVAPNEEPRVILVQDGVEFVRTVGSAG